MDGAFGRLEFAGQEAQDCRLAAAVGADEADLRAVGEEEVEVVEEFRLLLSRQSVERLRLHRRFDEAFGLAIRGGEVDACSSWLRCGTACRPVGR